MLQTYNIIIKSHDWSCDMIADVPSFLSVEDTSINQDIVQIFLLQANGKQEQDVMMNIYKTDKVIGQYSVTVLYMYIHVIVHVSKLHVFLRLII